MLADEFLERFMAIVVLSFSYYSSISTVEFS